MTPRGENTNSLTRETSEEMYDKHISSTLFHTIFRIKILSKNVFLRLTTFKNLVSQQDTYVYTFTNLPASTSPIVTRQ